MGDAQPLNEQVRTGADNVPVFFGGNLLKPLKLYEVKPEYVTYLQKQWYLFYCNENGIEKLQQLAAEIPEEKLQQPVGEIKFPTIFSYIPWGHHILIITKCKTLDEALFYIKKQSRTA